MQVGNITGNINDLWQVAYDSGELVSAETSITISDLEGDTDQEYRLIVRQINDDATTSNLYIRLNNDSGSNYGHQFIRGIDSAASAGRNTSKTEMNILASDIDQDELSFTEVILYAKSGKVRTAIAIGGLEVVGGSTTVEAVGIRGFSWSNTADEITSIVVGSNQADGLGVGSRIILLKKINQTAVMQTGDLEVQADAKIAGAWEKIYENTVSSSTASVTISNLEGNTDQIYNLIVRTKIGTATGNVTLLLNNDSGNNYGYQQVKGQDSTADANRDTSEAKQHISTGVTGEYTFTNTLIYAKSGFLRTTIQETVNNISGTTVGGIILYGYSWNNSGDEITSLTVVCSGTTEMDVGTNVSLWRLNL